MVLPPFPPSTGNAGYDLEQLLQIVSQIESAGLLPSFIRSFPHYAIGVEVARAILQRYRNNNANTRGLGPPPSHAVAVYPQIVSPAMAPSVGSVRYFVSRLQQLIEEQCPNRGDPNNIACEDQLLAAMQMAVVETVKIFRQRRLMAAGPQPSIGYPQQSGFGYAQPAIGYPSPPQGGYQSGYQQQGGYSQQQGRFVPQSGLMQQQSYVALPPPPSTDITGPPQMIGGHLAQQLASIPVPTCTEGGGGGGGRGGGFAPSNFGFQQQQMQAMNTPGPLLSGSLEQRLAAIPIPPPCYPTEAIPSSNHHSSPACGVYRGLGGGHHGHSHHGHSHHGHSHQGQGEVSSELQDDRQAREHFYGNIAGEWSDGVGGFKVKPAEISSHGRGGGGRGGGSGGGGGACGPPGNEDGVGGSKVKDVDE